MLTTLAVVLRLGRTHFKLSYGWMQVWVYALTLLIRPIAQVVFFGVVALFVTGNSDVSFWLVGNAIQASGLATLYPIGDTMVSERGNGTLALVVMSPLNKLLVFGGRSWLHGLHGVAISMISLVVTTTVFGLSLHQVHWAALLLSVVVCAVSVSALGLAIGSLGLLLTNINFVGNLVYALTLTLAGVNFPIADLPRWLQAVSSVLPLTRGVAAARLAFSGTKGPLLSLCGGELLVALGWLGVGYVLYLWIENRARRDATLDLY